MLSIPAPRTQATDHALWLRLQSRDVTALAELYDRYSGLLYRVLGAVAPAHAASIVEEVFVALWRQAPALDGGDIVTLLVDLATVGPVWPRAADTTVPGAALAALPSLLPFASLTATRRAVLLRLCLGQHTLGEIAVALDRDIRDVRTDARMGLKLVRLAQP